MSSICDDCIHLNVCGHEGVEEPAMTYCSDRYVLEERPQGEWIPVSERLPTENGKYLCSMGKAILEDTLILYYVADPKSFVEALDCKWDTDCILNYGQGWYRDEGDEYGWIRYWEDATYDIVIAWQPLPEPYKKGEEE